MAVEGIAGRERTRRSARGIRWALYGLEFVLISSALLATQLLAAKLWLLPNGDVDEYQQYAIAFWTQQPVGHALPVEYPPLAIVARIQGPVVLEAVISKAGTIENLRLVSGNPMLAGAA